MSSSLKTIAFRWPSSASSLTRCCSKASFSTTGPACADRVSPRNKSNTSASKNLPRFSHGLVANSIRTSTVAPSKSFVVATTRCYSSASSPSSQDAAAPALDWDSFFKLRLRRRRIQLLFSVSTGLAGGAGGAVALSAGLAEPIISQIPLDPFMTLGIMTLACGGMGWLIGPTIGNQVFYIINRQYKDQMMKKESEFFARIKKHRVDPTNSSAGNPGT